MGLKLLDITKPLPGICVANISTWHKNALFWASLLSYYIHRDCKNGFLHYFKLAFLIYLFHKCGSSKPRFFSFPVTRKNGLYLEIVRLKKSSQEKWHCRWNQPMFEISKAEIHKLVNFDVILTAIFSWKCF